MATTETFVLPDIISNCPFEYQINPYYEMANQATTEWLKNYDIKNPEKLAKWRFPLFAAMTHHTIDGDRLCVLDNYYCFAWVYDDFFDDGEWGENSIAAKHGTEIVTNVLRNPETFPKTSFVAAEMLRSIMLRMKNKANEECQRRFVRHLEKCFQANLQQVINRVQNIEPDANTYVRARRHAGGVLCSFDLIEYALDLNIPDEAINNSIIKKLSTCCNDLVAWGNDLYSFNVEQSWGETHNLVCIKMKEGYSLQQSIDLIGDLIKTRYDAYVIEKKKIPSWGSKIDQDVAIYLSSLEQWFIGFNHWSFANERYFGTAHKEVARTRVVTLLPRKAKQNQ